MAVRDYESKRFQGQFSERKVDSLTVEEALQININKKPFTVSMRTPGDDIHLVRGLLHSEGILKNATYIPDLIINKENRDGVITVVDMNIPESELGEGYSNSRSLLSVSSCGICGRTELEELGFIGKCIDQKKQFDVSLLQQAFLKMNKVQAAFNKSGGAHGAAAFDWEGKMICSSEDIGRHNAVDKVIGRLIMQNKLSEAGCMTVSGRISYEIVIKCFKARIPVLAAVSAPSSLAVDYAKELGITLLAFCRKDRATCYSNLHRIKENTNLNTQVS